MRKINIETEYRFRSGQVVTGYFHSTRKGSGFVQPEGDPDGDDMYVSPEFTLGAMDGDLVKVKVVQDGFSMKNEVIEVLEHHFTDTVGVVTEDKKKVFVKSINTKLPDIKISRKHIGEAKTDDMVTARFLTYGDGIMPPTGTIEEILGNRDEKGVDITAIVRELHVPDSFSEEELTAGEELAEKSPAEEERKDLRDLFIISVDEPGTKDMDDALSLVREGNLLKLGVHIADASWFIGKGTPLDREALRRGTSVYLPDRVIPMLPEKLSTGSCSLKAGEVRPAMSVFLTMDESGEIKETEIVPSVICVSENMSYPEAQAVLDKIDENVAGLNVSEKLTSTLKDMRDLAGKLTRRRQEQGEISFDLPEVKIILDDRGYPTEIQAVKENDAQHIVSSFMTAANEAVAEYMVKNDIPGIFRIQESPEDEAAAAWKNLIEKQTSFSAGENEDGSEDDNASGKLSSRQVREVLEEARGTSDENFVTFSALGLMSRAYYDSECRGHFGLGTPYYCHFTSPIRRYPDLLVHRILHEALEGKLTDARREELRDELRDVSRHCTETEHTAAVCERRAVRLKLAQYLVGHVGEETDGVISRVIKGGLFVELPDTCEGFIPIKSLSDDYYDYEEDACRLVGERSGRILRLGDTVHVRISSVNRDDNSVEFELTD